MNRKMLFIFTMFIVAVLAACGNSEDSTEGTTDELKVLEVDFQVPETAEVNEEVELLATVTFGDDFVTDAEEVTFEYWLQGHEEDSVNVDAENHGDGTYTANVTFEEDGVYEMFAHTTAKGQHTMPKRSIVVGDADTAGHEEHEEAEAHDHHGEHEEDFYVHFVEPEVIKVNQETELMVHVLLENEALEGAQVRYEITHDDSDIHDWVDTEESSAGEYKNTYTFTEVGSYTLAVHVENDEGLHEHTELKVEVEE